MSKPLPRRLIDVDSKREGKRRCVSLRCCAHNRNEAHNPTSPFSFMSGGNLGPNNNPPPQNDPQYHDQASDESSVESVEQVPAPPPPPEDPAPMVAFKANKHCNRRIQQTFGCTAPTVTIPRAGDKSTQSESDFDITHVCTHMAPLPTESARIIWRLLTDEVKNNPPNLETAIALHQLANNAAFGPTNGMLNRIPTERAIKDCFPVTVYQSVGGHIIIGKESVPKFISFVYTNMDPLPHRVKWYNLTGREQHEWIRRWFELGQPHERRADETVGLRGTDIRRIKSVDVLHTAMERTPSLADRRPEDHPDLTANQFNSVKKQLFPDQRV